MAFHIAQGTPNPLALEPGANASFAIEVFVDGDPVGPGEIIQVKLPEGLVFPLTGEIRYMNLDAGINQLLTVESREPDGRLVRFKAEAIGNQPEGFYSVNVQAAADATPGDHTTPDGLTIGLTTAPLNFRVGPPQPVEHKVYGTVRGDGTVVFGSGFTARRKETGWYEITLTDRFMSAPAKTATVHDTSWGQVVVTDIAGQANLFHVYIRDLAGQMANRQFSFIAMGLATPQA
ncbi:hypothetical protein [Streptomyces griseocarneus]|uniref:hypothetical protein n=1 Tax=Streptomyces griseocarneus TaxID=51201 RepID=UPI00167D8092|nr:hypothetical protein [Streptomyces griseocarneus]MBZ6477499.1 hypothetical protein [Streptomyces griseocarneus]GHG51748.1 hypothetical protein GCM10018779_12180 [Streptomyces griseocarneus]